MAKRNGQHRRDRSLGIVGLALLVALTSIVVPNAALGQILPEPSGSSEESQEDCGLISGM